MNFVRQEINSITTKKISVSPSCVSLKDGLNRRTSEEMSFTPPKPERILNDQMSQETSTSLNSSKGNSLIAPKSKFFRQDKDVSDTKSMIDE
jgi:hypothetical protein